MNLSLYIPAVALLILPQGKPDISDLKMVICTLFQRTYRFFRKFPVSVSLSTSHFLSPNETGLKDLSKKNSLNWELGETKREGG